ncbi:MAG: DNA polymerase III subunit delta [Clostridia bacterium]|nr:DNA polymerase III subunit delta [Clostridia bacterium]
MKEELVNSIIKEEEFRKSLADVTGRAFLFFGEEDYLKAATVKRVRELLCPDPGMAFFNDVTIDATDYTPDRLLDAMSAPPMMTEGKLIVLRGFDFNTMRAGEIDAMLEVLAQIEEYDYNCIIIYAAADLFPEGNLPKKPSQVLQKFATLVTPVHFETPTDAPLARWVGKHFAHCGVTASGAVCSTLINYTGKTMFTLAGEIEKLAAYVKENGRTEVTANDVKNVAVPALEVGAFALSNALLSGNGKEALDVLAVMKFERVEPQKVLGEISTTFSQMQSARVLFAAGMNIKEVSAALKIHQYKVGLISKALSRTAPARLARAITLAAEADLLLKNGSADYAPLEKLICAL